MKPPQTGGCQCGKIRYEITEEPREVNTCHCLDCQRLTSSAFSLGIVVPEKEFRLTGVEPSRLQRTADSGRVNTRLVCPECGSWVCRMARDGVVRVRAGGWTMPPGCDPRGTYGPAGRSLGLCSLRAMKSLRDNLPNRTGTVRWPGVPGNQGGRTLRHHRLCNRVHPWHHSCPPSRPAPGRDDCRLHRSTDNARGELVRLPLVPGSAQCEANCPASIIDGLYRVSGADVG
jgi:hypothetical protein